MAAKKRKSNTSRSRSYTPARRAAPRRRNSSGVNDIPKVGMGIGLTAANVPVLQTVASDLSLNGVKTAAQQAIQPEQLKKDLVYAGVGYGVGWAIKSFAPKFIKKPIAGIAKSLKRVF